MDVKERKMVFSVCKMSSSLSLSFLDYAVDYSDGGDGSMLAVQACVPEVTALAIVGERWWGSTWGNRYADLVSAAPWLASLLETVSSSSKESHCLKH